MNRFVFLLLFICACKGDPKPEQTVPTLDIDSAKIETPIAEIEDSLPPPPEVRIPDYDTSKWTDISFLEPSIIIDMKYATTDNFVESKMYDCGRCFLRPEVALAVKAIQDTLQELGFGLKMYDCFRPRPIQFKLWEKVPDPRFVSDPNKKGSMHNRGGAVDLTLVDADGKELNMGTAFDHFGREAYPGYTNLPDSVLANRTLLKETMLQYGFKGISTEWWHYSYRKKFYPLSDMLWSCESMN